MSVTEKIKLVLDTNVVLDWLVFADPLLHALAQAVRREQVVLYSHAPALSELQRVLGYATLKIDAKRQRALLDEYKRHTREFAFPAGRDPQDLLLPAEFPLCKDPDDQHFLALAFHAKADALVTRDRAVLSLRKRAKKFGVVIVSAQQLRTMAPTEPTVMTELRTVLAAH